MSRGARFKLEDLPPKARGEALAQLGNGPDPAFVGLFVDSRKVKPKVSIRQKTKPMPKTEADFLEWLRRNNAAHMQIRHHGITLLLGNGVRYTPDFFVFGPGERSRAYEVKGPRAWEDSIVKLKVAPTSHPWLDFFLATRDGPRDWKVAPVLPIQ